MIVTRELYGMITNVRKGYIRKKRLNLLIEKKGNNEQLSINDEWYGMTFTVPLDIVKDVLKLYDSRK